MAKPLLMVTGKDPIHEQGGGVGTYVRAHARAALALGFEPHLFCVGHVDGVVETDYGVVHRHKIFWPFPKVPGVGVRGLWIPYYAGALTRRIEEFATGAPQHLLIHGFNVWGYIGASAAHALRSRGRTIHNVVSGYTTSRHESRAKIDASSAAHSLGHRVSERLEVPLRWLVSAHYERAAFARADAVFYNYESARRLIEEEHHPDVPFLKLPCAAETAFTRPGVMARAALGANAPEPPLIISVSRHDPRKGLDILLEALAIVAGTGRQFRARLVGGGVLLADHRRLAERLGLDSVEIPGFVADAYEQLGRADIFVLPSLEEGSGSLSVLEALQAGLPAVVSACDGLPEDINDGENGMLVPPGEAAALAAALIRLLDDPPLRARLGAAARQSFERRFNATLFTEALGAAYASLGYRA